MFCGRCLKLQVTLGDGRSSWFGTALSLLISSIHSLSSLRGHMARNKLLLVIRYAGQSASNDRLNTSRCPYIATFGRPSRAPRAAGILAVIAAYLWTSPKYQGLAARLISVPDISNEDSLKLLTPNAKRKLWPIQLMFLRP